MIIVVHIPLKSIWLGRKKNNFIFTFANASRTEKNCKALFSAMFFPYTPRKETDIIAYICFVACHSIMNPVMVGIWIRAFLKYCQVCGDSVTLNYIPLKIREWFNINIRQQKSNQTELYSFSFHHDLSVQSRKQPEEDYIALLWQVRLLQTGYSTTNLARVHVHVSGCYRSPWLGPWPAYLCIPAVTGPGPSLGRGLCVGGVSLWKGRTAEDDDTDDRVSWSSERRQPKWLHMKEDNQNGSSERRQSKWFIWKEAAKMLHLKEDNRSGSSERKQSKWFISKKTIKIVHLKEDIKMVHLKGDETIHLTEDNQNGSSEWRQSKWFIWKKTIKIVHLKGGSQNASSERKQSNWFTWKKTIKWFISKKTIKMIHLTKDNQNGSSERRQPKWFIWKKTIKMVRLKEYNQNGSSELRPSKWFIPTNFLLKSHIRQPIASQWGRNMGYLLWIQPPTYVPPQSLQCISNILLYLGAF